MGAGLYIAGAAFLTYAKSMVALSRWTVATVREKFKGKPMTYTADYKNLASHVGYGPPMRNAVVKRVGILRRVFAALLDAVHKSRRRQTERDIANYVACEAAG